MSEHTVLAQEEPHRWRVTQTLVDEPEAAVYDLQDPPEPDNSTFLQCVIDLRDDTNPSGPILTLLKIDGT